jgi:hypothetical protein
MAPRCAAPTCATSTTEPSVRTGPTRRAVIGLAAAAALASAPAHADELVLWDGWVMWRGELPPGARATSLPNFDA